MAKAPKPGPTGYVSVVGTFKNLEDARDDAHTSADHAKTTSHVTYSFEQAPVKGGQVSIGLQLELQTLQTKYFKGQTRGTHHDKDGTLGAHEDRHKDFARRFFTTAKVQAIVKKEKFALVVGEDESDKQARAIFDYLIALEQYEGEKALDPPEMQLFSRPQFSGVTR
jgi:hypothetical protein